MVINFNTIKLYSNLTRKLIPPIGGVDVGPVIWIGVISFLREILVGQQGLIKLALHTHIP